MRPGAVVHLGEGEPLWENGIPAIALVTGPVSLLAETAHAAIDLDLLTRQIDSFRALQHHLADAPDRAAFGTVRRPGRLRKLFAVARIAWFLARRARR